MSYIQTLKRIRKNKTNYRRRQAILISKRNFITIKISNQNIHCQLIKPNIKGDVVLSFSNSKELAKYGWRGSNNNLSASYLVGLLLGKKMLSQNNDSAILYTGKTSFTSKVAACLKGIVTSGVNIPLSEDSFPDENRINGEHISQYASYIKSNQSQDVKQFSILLNNNIDPADYVKHFNEVKEKITSSFN